MTTESARKDFEEWFKKSRDCTTDASVYLSKNGLGKYCGEVEEMFEAWQAATQRQRDEIEMLKCMLKQARVYVDCAYECAFPDAEENARVLSEIDVILVPNVQS
jgi:hypothetical protein